MTDVRKELMKRMQGKEHCCGECKHLTNEDGKKGCYLQGGRRWSRSDLEKTDGCSHFEQTRELVILKHKGPITMHTPLYRFEPYPRKLKWREIGIMAYFKQIYERGGKE